MSSDEGSRTDQVSAAAPVTTEEDARLNEAMLQADQRLVASLRKEEACRRRRRRWLLGGTTMTVAVAAIVITSLMLGGPAPKPSVADMEKAGALTSEGWQSLNRHEYEQASRRFAEAVKLDPHSTNAWNGLGWSRFNAGNSQDSEKAFLECLKLDSSHMAALNGLGQIYLLWRQYPKAEEYLLKAAERNASAAWYGLARLYLLQGKYEQANKWARKVVQEQPNDETAKRMLAASTAKKLDPSLRQLIEPPDPTRQSPESKRGWVLLNSGEHQRAVKEFEQALKKNPNEVNAHNGLGFCLLVTGEPAAAKAHFETCLKLQPELMGAMNGLALCLKQGEGKTDEAIAIWEKMVKQFPGPHAGTSGLAWTYLEQKQYAKALPYFEQLVKAAPQDASLKKGLADARQGVAASQPHGAK